MNARLESFAMSGQARAPRLFVAVSVEASPELLAALEERYVLGANLDRLASARIATGPSGARTHRQSPEATQLDATAVLQSADHAFQDHADDALDVLLRQVRIFIREPGDEFRLDHRNPRNAPRLTRRDRTFAQRWLSLQGVACDSRTGFG